MKRSFFTIIFAFSVICGLAACSDKSEKKGAQSATPSITHPVKRGEFLRSIAEKYNVGWEAMLLANEKYLEGKYEETCGKLSEKYRERHGGLFCNDRYNRPYGNTLKPGWKLSVPSATSPENISRVVADIQGDKVALVIDDTGSMQDDRKTVGEFYVAALREHKKQLIGVWLYADGQVRRYEAGNVSFQTSGGRENTFGALQTAAQEKPDAIILITDEPGDDWDWGKVKNLPPVSAHCLADQGRRLCEANLQRLTRETRGQYVLGIR